MAAPSMTALTSELLNIVTTLRWHTHKSRLLAPRDDRSGSFPLHSNRTGPDSAKCHFFRLTHGFFCGLEPLVTQSHRHPAVQIVDHICVGPFREIGPEQQMYSVQLKFRLRTQYDHLALSSR